MWKALEVVVMVLLVLVLMDECPLPLEEGRGDVWRAWRAVIESLSRSLCSALCVTDG